MKVAVEVVDATGLTPKNSHGYSNPFVQVELDSQCQLTTTKLKALSPSWNETLLFLIRDSSLLRDLAIEVSVFHDHLADDSAGGSRKVRRRFFDPIHGEQRSFLGYARISGDAIASSPSEATVKSFPLKKRGVFSHARGDIAIRASIIPDSDKAPQSSLLDLWKVETESAPSDFKKEYKNMPIPEYELKEINPNIPGRKSSGKSRYVYDLVLPMELLYVRIIKARNLPTSITPFVEVCCSNFRGFSKCFHEQEPVWNQVFAFPCNRIHSNLLQITVKEMADADDYVGRIVLDLEKLGFFGDLPGIERYKYDDKNDNMRGSLPNSNTANVSLPPHWYRLADANDQELANGDIMFSMWLGTQADEAFHDSLNTGKKHKNNRSMVYYSPKLIYIHLLAIGAKDLVPSGTSRLINASLKVQIGEQVRQTTPIMIIGSGNPTWNEQLIFVASCPSDDPIVITVVDHIAANCEEMLGSITLPFSNIPHVHSLHSEPLEPKWYSLTNSGTQIIGQVQLCISLDFRYHVIDESPRKSSDFQPASKDLARSCIGKLEVGIIGSETLVPMKVKNGISTTDAYCVAKYGPKWVRTRTEFASLNPRWNDQFLWDVFDLCTVVTIAVFDDCRFGSEISSNVHDSRIGKISIRLSDLESGRIYTHSYPLLTLLPCGVKKMGELLLAVRFTCSSWVKTIALYGTPLHPPIHYMQPISETVLGSLQHSAVEIVCHHMARSNPSLPKEVVEYLLESDLSSMWSMRKSKTQFIRFMACLSDIILLVRWLNGIRAWKNPLMTILVDALFVILLCIPWIIPPGIFFSLFLVSIWNYRYRPRHPQHIDLRFSTADIVNQEELDEEYDEFPSTRSSDVVAMRYDRGRSIMGRIQVLASDLATQCERLGALLSWRDPRATFVGVTFLFLMSFSLYLIPNRITIGVIGLYLLNSPRIPSAPLNFFRRLPSKKDLLL